jgi:hypothetical protein
LLSFYTYVNLRSGFLSLYTFLTLLSLALPFVFPYTLGMKNLNELVEKIWSCSDRSEKIKLLTDMINTSHAKKSTKILALRDIVHMSNDKLDAFAINYSMSGMGMKVL